MAVLNKAVTNAGYSTPFTGQLSLRLIQAMNPYRLIIKTRL